MPKSSCLIGLLWSGQSFGESKISNLESQSKFQVKERKKLFKSVQKQRNWTVVVRTVIWGKYNIGFWIPIKFSSQRRRKNIQIGPKTTKLDICGPDSHLGKVQYRILNPYQISKSKKKKYSNRSINKKFDFCGPVWHLR